MSSHIAGDFCPDLTEACWYRYLYAVWDVAAFMHIERGAWESPVFTVIYIVLSFWPSSLICEVLGVVPLVTKVCFTAACCHDLLGVLQEENWRSSLADFCASTCDERDILMRHS